MGMFDIESSAEFYAMVVADFDDFHNDPQSSRRAMHCAISSYHLHDWLWVDWLKRNKPLRSELGIKSKDDFVRWIIRRCVWFEVIQAIANGSKHFQSDHGLKTSKVGGYGMGPYGGGGYGTAYLLVDLGEGVGEWRLKPAAHLLEVVVRFWRDFFQAYRPEAAVQHSPHHVD